MTKIFHLPLAAALVFLAASCSTKNLEPEIGAFGSSVDVALKSADREISAMKLDERLRDDKIAALVQAKGYYQLRCSGDYVDSFQIDQDNPQQISLAEYCPLGAFHQDDRPFDYSPSEEHLRNAVQARRLIVPLREYGDALEELSKSKGPEEVSKKFAAASKALRDLAIGASTTGGGEGIAPRTKKILEAGSGLAAILVREGLEAMRYAALKAIVTNGDEAVHGAGVILARWVQIREDQELSEGMQRVRDAEVAAIESQFDADPVEMLTKYDAVVSAYDAAVKADEAAKWRAFIAMVIAHKAMKAAFERPADFSALQEAHERLDDFVDQALKLKAAIEAEG